jgi:hypothetical protein
VKSIKIALIEANFVLNRYKNIVTCKYIEAVEDLITSVTASQQDTSTAGTLYTLQLIIIIIIIKFI